MKFYRNHFIFFIIAFILLTPIGTITHELGHLIVAKKLGYNTILHHSSVNWNNELLTNLKNQYEKFKLQIENNLPFEGQEEYEKNIKILNKHSLLILLGGVTQTIIFGSIAFILLIYRTRKNKSFTSLDWLLAFTSLFWVREPANLILSIIKGLKLKNNIYFYGDDAKIAKLLGLHEGALLLPLTVIALLISLTVLIVIPKNNKKEFIIAALIGCPIGFITWMYILGPIVLP